ncbi:hypothetical protein C7212DRAFT_347420 [Tuber magnatum]|uniref:Uncharacterized protein n=1 Tax=Tuber magnatum TaxID=42249 RepID=A0A317SJ99_9PEZI|nr:hypothetical protein C7212DRAFT_347420 [Tuber magnatum]
MGGGGKKKPRTPARNVGPALHAPLSENYENPLQHVHSHARGHGHLWARRSKASLASAALLFGKSTHFMGDGGYDDGDSDDALHRRRQHETMVGALAPVAGTSCLPYDFWAHGERSASLRDERDKGRLALAHTDIVYPPRHKEGGGRRGSGGGRRECRTLALAPSGLWRL